MVAETRTDDRHVLDLGALHDAVVDRVCDVVGIPPLRVVFVEPGSLPKTSSGKLQRATCKDQYHAAALASR